MRLMADRDRDGTESGRPLTVRISWRVLDGDTVTEQGSLDVSVEAASIAAVDDPPPPDGAGDTADVTIETDVATAVELRAGSLSAQHALLLGRLTLYGDVALLPALAGAIVGIDA